MQLLRALLSIVFIAIATIVGSVLALIMRLFDPSGNSIISLARLWSRLLLAFAGVKVTVEWETPIANDRPYVMMANHASAVDIWALYVALPIRMRMIAKKQLAAIPLFGWAMWAGRFIFIDRVNAVAARRSMDKAQRRIRDGETVLLFPEGTRSRDGRLAAFKKGGFHLAIAAGVPIVPLALTGTREAMPAGSFLLRSGHVHVKVGAPVETTGLRETHRHHLLEQVRGQIARMLVSASDPATVGGVPLARIDDASTAPDPG